MRVAVVGGTGLIGRQVVARMRDSGVEVVSLSRGEGVDLVTGEGLDTALVGVDTVVDVSNVATLSRAKAIEFFTTATGNLTAAAARAGVSQLIILSIVGVDRIPFGYYEGKLAQENAARASGVPTTILRATQFHEFAEQNLGRVPGPIALIPRMRVASVASSEVADELVRLATFASPDAAASVDSIVEFAGPETLELVDLARRVARVRRMRTLVIPLTLPGAAGRPMASGALLPQGDDCRTGTITFTDWLSPTR